MTSDLDLLRQFARENSQDAFAEIVRRHLNLVYSAALRQVRSPQLAEEIAQSVFADLARNANKLKSNTIVTAWLYSVTRRTAIDVIRKESRRQLREQIAVEMQAMNATANDWTQIAPLLDDAMTALDETDRATILLRYFENKNLREVGESLKISDDAAQKRVSRAVERLRDFFSKQNVTVGANGLAILISANAIQSAPITLAKIITAAAIAKGAAAGGSTFALVKGALKFMAWTKAKTSIVAGAIVLLAAGTATVIVKEIQERTFYIGQTFFPKGDSIEVVSVKRTGTQMLVKGRYNLVSADDAQLALYITTKPNAPAHTSPESNDSIQVSRGRGDFELSHSVYSGFPHVSMYRSIDGRDFADNYFGTKEEAATERKFHLSYDDSPQILITSSFVTASDASANSILNEFSHPQVPTTDPNSRTFRTLLARYSDAKILGSPRISTAHEATFEMTRAVKINGAYTNVGVILDVTPEATSNSDEISLKVRAELRELIDGALPTVRTTTAEETAKEKFGEMFVIRKEIAGSSPGEKNSLLVFVTAQIDNPAKFSTRLVKIIQTKPQ